MGKNQQRLGDIHLEELDAAQAEEMGRTHGPKMPEHIRKQPYRLSFRDYHHTIVGAPCQYLNRKELQQLKDIIGTVLGYSNAIEAPVSEAYQQNLTVKALVLRELQLLGTATEQELCQRLEELCQRASSRDSTFDFIHWVGTTLGGVLETFIDCGFVTCCAQPYREVTSTFEVTTRGKDFLQTAVTEVGVLMSLFDS